MNIKYFAMGFTTYITLATIHGWGDQDVMLVMLFTVVALWVMYFFFFYPFTKL